MSRRAALLATSFLCGANVMVQELLGFRVLAPSFGYSIYVWGNLLGLILGALAAGYFWGGKIADRRQDPAFLYKLIGAVAAYQLALLFGYRPVLEGLAGLGPVKGSCAATLVLFGPVMLGLSMVSPYVTKLLSKDMPVGGASGLVYGVSTLGSLAGVVAAAFLLIPVFGSHATLTASFAISLLTAAAGLWGGARKSALLLLAALPAAALSAPPARAGLLYAKDSAYFRVEVVRRGDRVIFYRDGTRSSELREGETFSGDYWDLFLLGAMFARPSRILILGMGTGTSLREYLRFFPEARIDAVELDPVVESVARRYFAVPDVPRLAVHVADARTFLSSGRGTYGFIELDVYRQPLQVPFYIATREFFAAVRRRLDADGVMMMNVVSQPGTEYLDRLAATVASEFPSVYAVRFKGNTLLFATAAPSTLGEVRRRIGAEARPELASLAARAQELFVYEAPAGRRRPFTDDLAPIEQLAAKALAR